MGLTKEDLMAISGIIEAKLKPIEHKMDRGFEKTEDRFAIVDRKFEAIDKHFEKVHSRLDQMDKRMDQMDKRMDRMDKRMDRMDRRMDGFEGRMDRIESKLDRIESNQNDVIMPILKNFVNERVEAYQNFNEKAAQIDSLSADMAIVKAAVASHGKKLNKTAGRY